MSILIRGMEMPERCGACFLRVGGCKQRIYMEQRPKYCPLIEVHTPHGRLIDADAVNKAMDERIEKLKDDKSIYEASCVATALDMFAPTVIEAEGGET